MITKSSLPLIFLGKILRMIFHTNVCLSRCAGMSLFRNHGLREEVSCEAPPSVDSAVECLAILKKHKVSRL